MDKKLISIWSVAVFAILLLSWWLLFRDSSFISSGIPASGSDSAANSHVSAGIRVLWLQELRRSLGAPGLSAHSPSFALGDSDGRVIFGDFATPSSSSSPKQIQLSTDPIIAAPIAIDDNYWAVGDENGVMRAFNAAGQILWQFTATGSIKGAAIIWQELLIFGSYDHVLYALDKHTGKERWRCETKGYIHGQAVMAPEQGWLFFANCEGQLQKLSAHDGKIIASLTFDSPIPETPTLGQDICLVLTHGGELIAIDQHTMQEKWRASTEDHYVSSPVINGDTIFLTTSSGMLHAYWPADDTWQHDLTAGVAVVPVSGGNNLPLYTVTTNGRIVQMVNGKPAKVNFLLDLQRDCKQPLALFGQKAILVSEDGAVIALEMPP